MSRGERSAVALVPARSGSRRLESKNVRPLGGHPLLAYSIAASLDSGVFEAVIVSTDSEEYAETARRYGAEVPFLRPAEFAGDLSPDIEWVQYTLDRLAREGRRFDAFSILRPTSPFRQASTIRRAWNEFLAERDADSLRAVELCRQHPAKMWVVSGTRMKPLLSQDGADTPRHSTPYQSLPAVYAQNASLEIAWSRVVLEDHSISGTEIVPFLTHGYEGLDVNSALDWLLVEQLIESGEASLPAVRALAEPPRITAPAGGHSS